MEPIANKSSKEKMSKISITDLTKRIIAFRDVRDWKQFHNPKDVALSLVLEAGEVMEHFQWKNAEEIEAYLKTNKADVAEELSDVFFWVLLIAHDLKARQRLGQQVREWFQLRLQFFVLRLIRGAEFFCGDIGVGHDHLGDGFVVDLPIELCAGGGSWHSGGWH